MHAACISSYGHHSPMIDFWCQEKVKKLKLWKKKTFHLLSPMQFTFFKLINHKAIDYKIISSPFTSLPSFPFCQKSPAFFCPPSHLLLSFRGMGHTLTRGPSYLCSLSLSHVFICQLQSVQLCSMCQ